MTHETADYDEYSIRWSVSGIEELPLKTYTHLKSALEQSGLVVIEHETVDSPFLVTSVSLHEYAEQTNKDPTLANRIWNAFSNMHPKRTAVLAQAGIQRYTEDTGEKEVVISIDGDSIARALGDGSLFNVFGFRTESSTLRFLEEFLAENYFTQPE